MTRTLSADTDISRTFAIAEGLEAVRQRVIQRLRLHRGEAFLAANVGVPWHQEILGQSGASGLANQIITDEILGVRDVTGVSNVVISLDRSTRRLRFTAEVDTVHGPAPVRTEV